MYRPVQRAKSTVIFWILFFLTTGTAFCHDHVCRHCGMKKSLYGYTWTIVVPEAGTATGFCSIHCASIDLALNSSQLIKRITVGDYNSHTQIDADRAFWVIGGQKTGVMTARAKWAFVTKAAADEFIKKFGGRRATFVEAIKATFEDMYEDILMIKKKSRMMKIRELPPQE